MTITIFITVDLSDATKKDIEENQIYDKFLVDAFECLKAGVPTQIKITNLPPREIVHLPPRKD